MRNDFCEHQVLIFILGGHGSEENSLNEDEKYLKSEWLHANNLDDDDDDDNDDDRS